MKIDDAGGGSHRPRREHQVEQQIALQVIESEAQQPLSVDSADTIV